MGVLQPKLIPLTQTADDSIMLLMMMMMIIIILLMMMLMTTMNVTNETISFDTLSVCV